MLRTEEVAVAEAAREDLQSALGELPSGQRVVIELSVLDGLDHAAPEYATANGAHVDFIAQSSTTTQASPRTIKAVYSAIEIVCQGGTSTVTPNIPKIALRLSKRHYRFAVKLPGVGTAVSATGVVESASLIVGTITVSSKLCHGSYHYAATPDPSLVPAT